MAVKVQSVDDWKVLGINGTPGSIIKHTQMEFYYTLNNSVQNNNTRHNGEHNINTTL